MAERPLDKLPDERKKLGEELKRRDAQIEKLLEECERLRSKRITFFAKPPSGKPRGGYSRTTWGDFHGRRHDSQAFGAFVADMRIIQPHYWMELGDLADCDGFLSEHPPVGYVPLSDYSYDEDCDCANWALDEVQKASPKSRGEALEGNHEYRVSRWIAKHMKTDRDQALLERLLSAPAVLSLEKRGIPYYRRGLNYDDLRARGTVKRHKCLYVHGNSHAKNAAEKHAQKAGTNVVFGHTHRHEAKIVSNEHSGPHGAWNPGCLCGLHPMWKHSEPTDWSHGYGLQFFDKDGYFLHLNVPIIDGRSLLWPMLKALGVTK